MNKLLLVVCVMFTATVFAQKAPIKFGDIPMADLTMTRYPKDSSASAVILADYGESSLQYDQTDGFKLKFERIIRIKILTSDGLSRANFSIPLYHDGSDGEKVSSLKAVTYNLENGKVTESKMKSDATFKEKYDTNIDLMKLTLPNVKVGSVIEITYTVGSDFVFNFQDWEFQDDIPTVWSEYRARIPEYFYYEKYVQGYISMFINESSQAPTSINIMTKASFDERSGQRSSASVDKIDFTENRYRWVAKDVPAFKAEPFISASRNYISKINFELSYTQYPNSPRKNYMGSWEDINKLYSDAEDFGGQVRGNGFLKKYVDEVTAGLTTPQEKIAAIHNYVRQNIEWNGSSRKFINTSLRKVMDDKKGNSAEVNLLLASMLEKGGFKVSPVLISTRDHGFIRETTPVSSQFNDVICYVEIDDKVLLLDATSKLLPISMLPERCLNGSGFVVSKEGFKWVKLQSGTKSRSTANADLTLLNDGSLKGKLNLSRTGYNAATSRKAYLSKGESEYIKDFVGTRPWEISKSEFSNTKELTESFKETHEVAINDHVTSAGETMYINPFVIFREHTNPFTIENREYPVDYTSPYETIYMLKLTLPEGYAVDEMPLTKVFMLPSNSAKYSYNVSQAGNIINIVSNFQINKALYSQDEYPNLREFYNQIVAKQAEQIVLKKK